MASKELEDVLRLLESAAAADPNASLEDRRQAYDNIGSMFPISDGTKCEDAVIGGVSGLWIEAKDASADKAILYLHGGGYVIGSPTSHRHLTEALSAASGAAVFSADYRLAPEHPYPAAVEDAAAAYQGLLEEKGLRPDDIMIAGDSAGGGLTIAALLMIRDHHLPMPAGGLCLSPWVDLTGNAVSMTTRAALDPMVQKDGLLDMARQYLNGKDAETAHLASPIFARLDRLPPIYIQTGTDEVLYDDALRLAGRAARSGVDVTLELWDEMIHVWHFFHPMLPEGHDAIYKLGAFFRKHVG